MYLLNNVHMVFVVADANSQDWIVEDHYFGVLVSEVNEKCSLGTSVEVCLCHHF